MRTITVNSEQCLLDVAMQHCGAAIAVYDIADLNGLSLTDDLTTGQKLLVSDVLDAEVVEMFSPPWLLPASAERIDGDIFGEGLEYWIIERDFQLT